MKLMGKLSDDETAVNQKLEESEIDSPKIDAL